MNLAHGILCLGAAALLPLGLSAQTYSAGDSTASTLVVSTTISTTGENAGAITLYAGSYTTPGTGQMGAFGASLDQTAYADLFTGLGTTYGSASGTTFNVPDLAGWSAAKFDPTHALGTTSGTNLSLNLAVARHGVHVYESFNNTVGTVENPFMGQVVITASSFTGINNTDTFSVASGQLIPISGNEDLFAHLGTAFGGNGQVNFALPDLRNRVVVGASGNHGQMTSGNLPLRYLVATQGLLADPTVSPDATYIHVGQLIILAGTGFGVPEGWLDAEGQTLAIASNANLFSVIGTTYGGDGVTTFALPDFRDRTFIGASAISAVPEPSTYALLAGLGALGLVLARRRAQL